MAQNNQSRGSACPRARTMRHGESGRMKLSPFQKTRRSRCSSRSAGALVASNKTCAREPGTPGRPWPRSVAAGGITVRQLWYGVWTHTAEEIDNCRVHQGHALAARHTAWPPLPIHPRRARDAAAQRRRETRTQTTPDSALSNTQSNTHAMQLDRGRRPPRRPGRVEPGPRNPPTTPCAVTGCPPVSEGPPSIPTARVAVPSV